MALSVDQDQKWLIDCLNATLDTNRELRSFAEASLQQASLQPGYGAALTKITINKDIAFGLRQLAAVLLKQFIKQHWEEGEENFVHPVVSAEEKRIMHQLLLPSLDDPNRKIRTAISMAIVSIAQYDWPDDWPELLPFLLKLISEKKNIGGVHGALKCLDLLSGELDDALVPKLLPALFPHLHSIISSPHLYEKSLRTKALAIVHSCISVLGSMSGLYEAETAGLLKLVVDFLMEQFSIILQPPMRSDDPDEWSMRMEVLKCLLQLVQNFPSLMETRISVISSSLWQTFVSSLDIYQILCIQGTEDSRSGIFDSDGNERSLDAFIIQLFETILTIVGNAKMAKVIRGSIKQLIYHTIAFLQMTEEQVHTWSFDANQYVAHEDDVSYSCRVSGSLLLEEIASAFGREMIDSIVGAVKERFRESQNAKLSGSVDWWKLREASFFALVSVSEQLIEAQDSGATNVSLSYFLDELIAEDVTTDVHKFPFLHARIFSVVSKFSSVIGHTTREHFLYAAAQAIASDVPPPVKVGACQVLCQLLPDAKSELIQPRIMSILSSLIELLKQASDETLHLVLETLKAAVKAGHELSRSLEPVISPVMLDVWVHHISDPFISIDALEVLEAIKNAPGCMQPLVTRIIPSIASILENPRNQTGGLLAGSFDLLTMILKGAPVEVVKAVFDNCFNSTIQVVLETDDHGELQNATECLAAFLAGGKHELLSWNGDPSFTMKRLLDAASRLLDPSLESSGSLFVSSYVLQLIFHFPSEMAFHIRELVAAIVRRMQSCEIAGLKCSLIVVLARLVHFSSPDVNQFINLLLSVSAQDHQNSFSYVMSEWTKLQGEIQGAYQIKVTTTALALLLSSRHEELAKVNVQGHLVKV
ncbi:importin-9 isoform X2 [Phalaenopsis equestris]|uniref:importin-9 isoform X2 n=1 Tax=Phalaenopsis equestris TaxID=78828 RepID=UPI0009E65BD0|nr:importin-9 isoform X2 [Phalaenopsis equestris]